MGFAGGNEALKIVSKLQSSCYEKEQASEINLQSV